MKIRNLLVMLTGILTVTASCAPQAHRIVESPVAPVTLNLDSMTMVEVSADPPEGEGIENWLRVAEDKGLVLYLNPHTSGFAVENTNGGKLWYSNPPLADEDPVAKAQKKTLMKSQFTITYAREGDESASSINSFAGSVNRGDFDLYRDDSGFVAVYHISKAGITLPIRYELKNGRLCVSVLTGAVEEDDGVQLLSVSLLPYMGAASSEDEGYMLVPDGMGALIHFDNDKTDVYSQKLYSRDYAQYAPIDTYKTEPARLPVFGAKFDQDGYLAIITQGEADATICADTGGTLCNYNALYSDFILRATDTRLSETFKVDTYILPEDAALPEQVQVQYAFLHDSGGMDYTDLAACYREYLLTEGGLARQKTARTTAVVDLYGTALESKVVVAVEADLVKPLTTYNQVVDIVDQMRKIGITDIWVNYHDWSRESVYSKISKKAESLGQLGGKKELQGMQDRLTAENTNICFGVKLINLTSGSWLSRNSLFAKNIQGEPIEVYPYKLSTYGEDQSNDPTYLLTYGAMKDTAAAYVENLKKLSVDGISLDDMGLFLYTDYSSGKACITPMLDTIKGTMADLREQFGFISVKRGNAFMLPYADLVTDAPSQSSRYDVEDEEVPFYQLVLHGLVPYTVAPINGAANPADQFLIAVATGSLPSYQWIFESSIATVGTNQEALFSASYTDWLERAADQYERMLPLMKKNNQLLVGYSYPISGVSETLYEDGTRVLVNYTEDTLTVDNVSVPAKNFVIQEG